MAKNLEKIINKEDQSESNMDIMKLNLIILVILSIGLISFVLLTLIFNLFYSLKYINSTLKLLCSIPMKDYKNHFTKLLKNDEIFRKHSGIEHIGNKM